MLGLPRAFYGLLAEGWDLSDFGKPGTKGPLPEDAHVAELIVGFFDLERTTGFLATPTSSTTSFERGTPTTSERFRISA